MNQPPSKPPPPPAARPLTSAIVECRGGGYRGDMPINFRTNRGLQGQRQQKQQEKNRKRRFDYIIQRPCGDREWNEEIERLGIRNQCQELHYRWLWHRCHRFACLFWCEAGGGGSIDSGWPEKSLSWEYWIFIIEKWFADNFDSVCPRIPFSLSLYLRLITLRGFFFWYYSSTGPEEEELIDMPLLKRTRDIWLLTCNLITVNLLQKNRILIHWQRYQRPPTTKIK